VTLFPGPATPVKTGLGALVMPSPATPLSVAGVSPRVGAGSDVLIVRLVVSEVLPAASAAMAVMLCLPIAKGAAGVQLQVPAASVWMEPTKAPSIRRLTVAPGSAAPVKVGCATEVMPSPTTPLSLAAASAMVGAIVDVSIVSASLVAAEALTAPTAVAVTV
jgi:hypothetical protein